MSRPAHLGRHLAGELQQVVVQEEEPRQAELADEPELLLQARRRVAPQAVPGRVAHVEPRRADLRERAVGGPVLRAGVAVAEVLREVEGQRRGQPRGLGHRVGVVLEARGHRLRRRQDVAVVAAAQRLGRVERRVLAQRDERVLQRRARVRVGVHIAGRDARDAEPPGQGHQPAVQRAVATEVRALELDPEGLRPEGRQEPSHRRLVTHALARASREADEPLRVRLQVGERQHGVEHAARRAPGRARAAGPEAAAVTAHDLRDLRRRVLGEIAARVRMRTRQEPAEVAPARGVAHQQRHVTGGAPRRRHRPGRRCPPPPRGSP